MKFKPMPGIVIIKLIEKEAILTLTTKVQTRLLKGQIVALGNDLTTDIGATLKISDYVKLNDIVYFLSYEGNYDNAIINNEKYYMVKIQDLRTSI